MILVKFNLSKMNLGSFQPGSASMPCTQVEMSLRCEDLSDKDLTSKSDPTCVLFVKRSGSWQEFGRTEKIQDTHHPRWETKFIIDYRFEERHLLKLAVYDIDSSKAKLDDHDFLGDLIWSIVVIKTQMFCVSQLIANFGSRKNHMLASIDPTRRNIKCEIFVSTIIFGFV